MFADQSGVYSPGNAQGVPAANSPTQQVPRFQIAGQTIALTHRNMLIGALVILAVLWHGAPVRRDALMERDVLAIVGALWWLPSSFLP